MADQWAEFNDLVTLRNVLASVEARPPTEQGDPRMKLLRDGYTELIDFNCRLRYWLRWVLVAAPEELDQWRNGEHAREIANAPIFFREMRARPQETTP